jgi:hypothetical protein
MAGRASNALHFCDSRPLQGNNRPRSNGHKLVVKLQNLPPMGVLE